jgi:L-lactate dehydrogenase complex protein LldE
LSETAVTDRPRVALFVTCLVDLFRPSIGFAAIRLLERAGCEVIVPTAQTCCGQPAFNSGDRAGTEAVARGLIPALEGYDYVVVPSGSCGGTLARHYPELFDDDPPWKARAAALAAKCHELVSFLVDVRGLDDLEASLPARATYHDSCSGLRELGVKRQPRRLLGRVEGLELVEMTEAETCCGFGGTFCVKYPAVSTAMVDRKLAHAAATGAGLLLAGDLGCLLTMAGRVTRTGSAMEVRHVAEVLAGELGEPPIGTGRGAPAAARGQS